MSQLNARTEPVALRIKELLKFSLGCLGMSERLTPLARTRTHAIIIKAVTPRAKRGTAGRLERPLRLTNCVFVAQDTRTDQISLFGAENH